MAHLTLPSQPVVGDLLEAPQSTAIGVTDYLGERSFS